MHIYGHDVRAINTNGGPFSFWKSIYVNPAVHEANDLKSILQHKQIHVNESHTQLIVKHTPLQLNQLPTQSTPNWLRPVFRFQAIPAMPFRLYLIRQN